MSQTNYTPDQDLYIFRNAGKISFSEMGKFLGKTKHQVRGRHLYLTQQFEKFLADTHEGGPQLKPDDSGVYLKTELTSGTQVIECVDPKIETVDDLLKHCKIDLNVWKIEKAIVNKYGGFAKTSSEKISDSKWVRKLTKLNLYQVKVVLALIDNETKANRQLREELVKTLREHSPDCYKPIKRTPLSEPPIMAVISIFDHHWGKLAWEPETGSNYDLKIAERLFNDAIEYFYERIKHLPVDTIVLPIGNDFFHTDNAIGTTYGGTPQDTDGRWQKCYLKAKQATVRAIDILRQKAKVHVPVVPGNHDLTKIFYLGDAIETHYRLDPEVSVDNGPTTRKYIEYGQTLLGFTHGNEEKHDKLPGLMAREKKDAWARTSHQEWMLGHVHKKKEDRFNAGDVFGGVYVRVIPSLCAADAWHARRGYVDSPKASECYLYAHDSGFNGMFNFKGSLEE